MSNYRLTGGSLDDANQAQNGFGYTATGTQSAANSNAATNAQWHSAIRFPANTLAHSEVINRARFGIRFISGTNGAKFDVYGHKVVNSPALATTGPGTNDVMTRLSTLTTANVQIRLAAAPDSNTPYYIDVTAIVQEIVNQTSWVTGNAITFLLKSYNNATFSTLIQSNDQTQSAFFPELYVDYGAFDPAALDLDVLVGTASFGVCEGQGGAKASNVTVVAAGWTNQVIAETYVGAVSSVSGSTIFGGGDQHRGYSPNGLVQDSMEALLGSTEVKVFLGEFAKGGTTIEQWNADITASSGTGLWDGAQTAGAESLNHRLAHPQSPSKRGIFWLSPCCIGNSIFTACSSGNQAFLMVPRGTAWGSTDWSDSTDMTKSRNTWVAALEAMITHIFAVSTFTDLRIVIPGLPNFQVYGNAPAAYHYAPDVSGQPLERLVASTGSFGVGYPQVSYDGISSTVRTGALNTQSTYIQAAGQYQISTYGAWDPNNTFQWNASLFAVATTPISSPRTWNHPLPGLGSTDLWKHAMRNVTDITVNQFMVGETHAVIQRVMDLHPEWHNRVFFLPHPQAVNAVQGTDPQSADSSSVYAQPLWQGASTVVGGAVGQYEGIHQCARYFRTFVDAVVAEMNTRISFLPGFIPATTTTVATLAVIDGAGTVIDPSPTSLVVGERYQRDIQFTAVGGDLAAVSIDVDTLTSQLDGGATLRVTTVPAGTSVLAETAINQGDIFTGLGTLLEGDAWRVRVRGTCVV